jgi:hypothetical protein
MAVGSAVGYNAFTGNGATVTFAYNFTLLDADDLVVTVDDVVSSTYTISGLGNPSGGSITFSTAPAAATAVLLQRVIALSRVTDYQSNGDLLADTVNDDFDRLWMAVQQSTQGVDSSIHAPGVETLTVLPAAASRVDRFPVFDATTGDVELSPVTVTQVSSAVAAAYAAGSTADAVTYLPAGTGAVSASVQTKLRQIDVSVTDFGAVGDGATDSTAALALAVAHVNSLCDVVSDSLDAAYVPRLIFPPSLGFKTTATLSIRAGVEVVMRSPLLVVGVSGAALIGIDMIDSKGVDYQAPRSTNCVFDVRRVTQSNWSTESDIGVRIPALYVGTPFFKRVSGFCVGVNGCFGYGQVRLGDIRDAKRSVIITARTTPENFTNHLRVIGGTFSCGSGVGSGLSRYGITVLGTSPGGANTLLFDGQSFELNTAVASPGESIPYQIDGTSANVTSLRAINQRSEINGGRFAQLLGTVRNCEFAIIDAELEYTYPSSLLLDDQSTGGGANIAYRHSGATAPHWTEFFSTGRLSERAVALTGSAMSVVNMECMTSAGASPTPPTFSASGGLATFDSSQYMSQSGPYYGVRVRLNGARSIAISGRKPASNAADIVLTCFDASGTQITSAGAVSFEQSAANLNTGIYGGLYSVGINPSNAAPEFDAVIAFASTVATVFIAVSTKTDGWVLKRADARPEWFSSTSHMPEQFVGSAIPVALTNVTYKQGMRVAQLAATAGQPKGWVCTVPGVPTFVSEGNL